MINVSSLTFYKDDDRRVMPRPTARAKFAGSGGEFKKDLDAAVEAYLARPGVETLGYRRLHRKAAFIGAWAVGSYVVLMVAAHSWWQVVVSGVSLVLALATAMFNISHDGNHGGFSKNRRVNRLAGFVLDLAGGSSFIWKFKHNQAHHTYPNVVGYDDDIDAPPLARFASSQEYRPWYRWQHLYLWPLYGLMIFRWQFWGDFESFIRGRIGCYTFECGVREVGVLLGGKVLFFSWALALPLALHWSWQGALVILLVFMGLNWAFSFILTLTFQLAHCVDETMFTSAAAARSGRFPNTWAKHQVLTTSDFCPNNWFITWFLGGLNYQVVHHLFPHIPHVHYPAIAAMVRRQCGRHGIPYNCQPTLRAAIRSHHRHLRNMGRSSQAATV